MEILKNKNLILLFLALSVVTAYEISILTDMSLWHDEAFSGLLPKYNWKEMLYRIGLDVHPPLYYILLKIWVTIFGNTVFTLRLFSVFFGILTVITFYFFLKEAFQFEKLALFCSVLLAFNSFFMQYVIEARMYTLGTFLIVLSSLFLLLALKNKKWKWWLLYAISVSAGIYTHYYIFFSIFAQGLFFILWILKEEGLSFIHWVKNQNFQLGSISYLLVALFYLPWFKTFFYQLRQVQESYWIPSLNVWSVPITLYKLTTGQGIDPVKFGWLLIGLTIVISFVLIFFLLKLKGNSKWLVSLLFIIPFLSAILFSLKTSIYLDRYFVFVIPFYATLIGATILAIENKLIRNILIVLTILGTLVAFPIRWADLDVKKKPGMAAAADYLNQNVKPEDKIYVGSSFVYFTFKYYNQTPVHPKLYAPWSLPHFYGTALLSSGDIIKDFSAETKKGDIVWMINTTGFGNYQPKVPENWIKIVEKKFQDVYDYRGWIIVTKYQVQ